MDEAAVRRIVNEAVQAAAAQFAANANNQGRPNAVADEVAEAATPNPSARWNANELGFFDPHYNDKTVHSGAPPIEHAGKDTYFRDIHLFLDRAKQFVPTKGTEMIRDNLWLSLRGTALS